MNTDVILEFKSKEIDIESKIKRIENIGFNINNFKEELNNRIVTSKKQEFEFF